MTPRRYGTIEFSAWHADGELAMRGTISTNDAHGETLVMRAALEVERASRRGVRVPPRALGALIVMAPDASLWSLLCTWRAARRAALAKRRSWELGTTIASVEAVS